MLHQISFLYSLICWSSQVRSNSNSLLLSQGYSAHVVSTVSEWLTALTFLGYFFTFVQEFRKFDLEINTRPLVRHLDEDPFEGTNERTRLLAWKEVEHCMHYTFVLVHVHVGFLGGWGWRRLTKKNQKQISKGCEMIQVYAVFKGINHGSIWSFIHQFRLQSFFMWSQFLRKTSRQASSQSLSTISDWQGCHQATHAALLSLSMSRNMYCNRW